MARSGAFKKTDKEAAQRDAAGSSYWKPKVGKNRIRILPPSAECKGNKPWFKYMKHYRVGPSNAIITCEAFERGTVCPGAVCRYANKVANPEIKDEISPKITYRVAIWDFREPEKGVQIWEPGQQSISQLANTLERFGDFTDLDKGYDISVTKIGEGRTTKYECDPYGRETGPLPDDIWKWLDENDMPNIEAVKFSTEEEKKQALYDEDDDDFEEDDEDEGFSVEEGDDEDDDEDFEDGDDEDLVDEDDEDFDDEEAEEDDEEELVRKKTRRTAPAKAAPASRVQSSRLRELAGRKKKAAS